MDILQCHQELLNSNLQTGNIEVCLSLVLYKSNNHNIYTGAG